MSILVTGGAGYIGSATIEALRARGRDVVVLDDLSTGHAAAVPPDVELVVAGVGNADAVNRIVRERGVTAALHFAARSSLAESVVDPATYYRVNVAETLGFLGALESAGVRHFIFSSTASVYDGAAGESLTEESPIAPDNPYGATKATVERALSEFSRAYGWRALSLRYFNAAGATAERGEDHRPETHLIPLALRAARGEGEPLEIFGTDYPTRDGTCVRDYIHVADLAEAHVLGLEALEGGHGGGACNLGNGRGFTVREVIRTVESVLGCPVPMQEGPRRAGDPQALVASAERARRELGWQPRHTKLEEIIVSAAAWMDRYPKGYGSQGKGAP